MQNPWESDENPQRNPKGDPKGKPQGNPKGQAKGNPEGNPQGNREKILCKSYANPMRTLRNYFANPM